MAAAKPDDFAADLIHALRTQPIDQPLVDRTIHFLTERLTEAAISGCHHCGEGEPDSPCWWCGLKNKKE